MQKIKKQREVLEDRQTATDTSRERSRNYEERDERERNEKGR